MHSLTSRACSSSQAAFRDKAMLYHPENNREKDPKKRGIFVSFDLILQYGSYDLCFDSSLLLFEMSPCSSTSLINSISFEHLDFGTCLYMLRKLCQLLETYVAWLVSCSLRIYLQRFLCEW